MADEDDHGGSEDLIRQAKDSLTSPGGDTPEVTPEPPPLPEPEELQRPAPEPVYDGKPIQPATYDVPSPMVTQDGPRIGRAIGIVILVLMAIFWMLLIIGLFMDPIDWIYGVIGGLVITALPIAGGVYLIRRSR